MEHTDNKEQTFPEGFQHVEERLNETADHLKQLDDQIRNIPKEQGPKPVYRPPHYIGHVVPGSRDKTRIALQEKQHEIRKDALSKTEADTWDADNKSGRVVRDKVRERLFPNPYRQMSKEDRLDDRNTAKDIEQSQDYMDAQLVARAAERQSALQPQKEMPEKGDDLSPKRQDKAEMSLSARFSLSLGYTRLSERTGKEIRSSRDHDKDMDRG